MKNVEETGKTRILVYVQSTVDCGAFKGTVSQDVLLQLFKQRSNS
jgi:hypothetical protein